MPDNLRELQRFDIENVFYNVNEFSFLAKWEDKEFLVNRESDYEVEDTRHKHFLAQSKDVAFVKEGDSIEIDNIEYEVFSISDVEDSCGLEKRLIMGLV